MLGISQLQRNVKSGKPENKKGGTQEYKLASEFPNFSTSQLSQLTIFTNPKSHFLGKVQFCTGVFCVYECEVWKGRMAALVHSFCMDAKRG